MVPTRASDASWRSAARKLSKWVALLSAPVLLASAAGPGVALADDYSSCDAQLSAHSGWRDLKVKTVSCIRGAEVARAWIRRYSPFTHNGRRPRNPQTVQRWSCRLEVLMGYDNPYGRVTCRRGTGRVRFYGYS